jgi:hypothetical protein
MIEASNPLTTLEVSAQLHIPSFQMNRTVVEAPTSESQTLRRQERKRARRFDARRSTLDARLRVDR